MENHTDESSDGEITGTSDQPKKMLVEKEEKLLTNGNQPDDSDSTDRTAQVLKDIAILNGQTPEFNDDHIKSFTSKEPMNDSAENDVHIDSGINSVSSNCAESKVENGADGHSDEDRMDTSENSGKPSEVERPESRQSSSSDVVEIPESSDEEEFMDAKESVEKSDDDEEKEKSKTEDEFKDSEDSQQKEEPAEKAKAPRREDPDDSVVVIDQDDSNDSCSVKSLNTKTLSEPVKKATEKKGGDEVAEVYDKVLEELDSEDEEKSLKGYLTSKPKTDQVVIVDKSKEDAGIKESPMIVDESEDSTPNLKIDQVISLKKPEPAAKPAVKPPVKKPQPPPPPPKPQNAEIRPMANLLAQVGFDLVREHVYKDLIHQQTKKRSNKKLTDREEEQIVKLEQRHDEMVKKNDSYNGHKVKTCKKCSYTSVSQNQFEFHNEHVHQGKNGAYQCAMCDNFESKNKTVMAYHMEAEHNRICRWLLMPLGFYVCPLCRYDCNTQNQFQKHRTKCDRMFKLTRNLEPSPADSDIPIKPLLKPKPLVTTVQSKKPIHQVLQRSGGNRMMTPLQASLQAARSTVRPTVNSLLSRTQAPQVRPQGKMNLVQTRPQGAPGVQAIQIAPGQFPNQGQGPQIVQIQGQLYTLFYTNGQAYLTPVSQNNVVQGAARPVGQVPIQPGGLMGQPQLSQPRPAVAPRPARPEPQSKKGGGINDISRMIAARAIAQAAQNKAMLNKKQPKQSTSNSTLTGHRISQTLVEKKNASAIFPKDPGAGFEICEVCGGFVKDADSLRIHFYWAHKIDIPKSVFNNKQPHLLCGKKMNRTTCTGRFWTYQGLQRHREIAHSQTDNPNSKLQTRTCYMCGEQGIISLIGHLRTQHYLQVGSWLRSFKCVCCGCQFSTRASLENHLLSAHGKVFLTKGLIDQLANFSSNVTPRPGAVPTGIYTNAKTTHGVANIQPASASAIVYPCNSCDKDFTTREAFDHHQKTAHSFKCSRCSLRFGTRAFLTKHYTSHKNDKDECPLCKERVMIGRPFVRHMKRTHMKECSVALQRLSKAKEKFYLDKYGRELAEAQAKRHQQEKSAGVIVLDSDDEGEKVQKTKASSKRVSDHSTSPEPPAKRARREVSEEVLVLDLDEDGNEIGSESSSPKAVPTKPEGKPAAEPEGKRTVAESKKTTESEPMSPAKPEAKEEEEEDMDTSETPAPQASKDEVTSVKDDGDAVSVKDNASVNGDAVSIKDDDSVNGNAVSIKDDASLKDDKIEDVLEVDGETIVIQKEDD